jgi:hypothetical protein
LRNPSECEGTTTVVGHPPLFISRSHALLSVKSSEEGILKSIQALHGGPL